MDSRESGRYDPNINNHPPACTCAECTNRRLGKKKQAIWSNLRNYLPFKRPEPEPKPEPASDEPTGKGLSSSPSEPTIKTTKTLKQALGWLMPAVLIFSCTLIGFGISLFIGTAIPLWLLLGFSLIISIEKWFHYTTRKYKYIGKLYRLFLNLSVLCLLGLIIWSGVKLFSQQYFDSPLIGSLVFLVELIFFIWIWRIVSKNSWRQPSMKLTVFSLTCIFIILAFAGVQPISKYKNQIFDSVSNIFSGREELSSVSTPPTSQYPADVIGRVVMTTTVKQNEQEITVPSSSGIIYWIVDITAKNKSYQQPMTDRQWTILAGDEEYEAHGNIGEIGSSYPMTLMTGETGATIVRFAVPDTLKVSDANLCYQGQQPYSLGQLTGGDKVAGYDWGLKTVVTEVVTPPVESKVVENWNIQLDSTSWKGGTLTIVLTITNLGPRRNFGYAGFDVGPEIAAIDSTGKLMEPWVPEPDFSKGELFHLPPYTKEFYPNESWSGTLKFEMSLYSGETKLYMTRYYHARRYFLFNLGEPRE